VVLATIAAIVAALYAALGPTYESCGTSDAGEPITGCRHESTVTVNGSWVLIVLAVPIVVALLPLVFDRRTTRIVSVVLLWTFTVITGFSVGSFFVPAAVLMTVAAVRSDPVPTTVG
jgi:hypothetical protein